MYYWTSILASAGSPRGPWGLQEGGVGMWMCVRGGRWWNAWRCAGAIGRMYRMSFGSHLRLLDDRVECWWQQGEGRCLNGGANVLGMVLNRALLAWWRGRDSWSPGGNFGD